MSEIERNSLLAFVPPDLLSQLAADPDCDYCAACPSIPCVLHSLQPKLK